MDGVDTKKSLNDTEHDVGYYIKWHQRGWNNNKKYDRSAHITQQISSIDGRVCYFFIFHRLLLGPKENAIKTNNNRSESNIGKKKTIKITNDRLLQTEAHANQWFNAR